jgi:putative ABC transport system permease protein
MFEQEWDSLGSGGRIRLVRRAAFGLITTAIGVRLDRSDRDGVVKRRSRLGRWMSDAHTDVRLATRSLVKRPAFSLSVVVTLVLGIGLNTAMFSMVHGLLLRPLPYDAAHRLVQLSETAPDIGSMDVSLPDFALWRTETRTFSGMFAFDDTGLLLTGPDQPEIAQGAVVSPGFLKVLGVAPLLGRDFLADEEVPGSDAVAIISYSMWERRFGRDPGVLDRTLLLNGRVREIVGVAPPAFHFPEMANVWVPLAFDANEADPQDYGYDVIARLSTDATLDAALAEAAVIAGQLARTHPGTKAGIGATAYPLRWADVPAPLAVTVVVLLVAVGLVLLMACTNAASLMLARGEDRRGEMAMRRALGAGTGRIVRQVLAETAVLCSVGVAGAVWVAHVIIRALPDLLPADRAFWIRFDLDPLVLGWTAATGVAACLLVGIPPALRAARTTGRPLAGSAAPLGTTRRWMLGAQVAIATMLVAGATLASRALINLNKLDPGLNPQRVLVLATPLPPWSYPQAESRVGFVREALSAVRSLPTVSQAAAIASVPFLGSGAEVAVESETTEGRRPIAHLNSFTDDYFATMQVPVLEGTLPTAADIWQGAPIAAISASLAERLWPGGGAVGKQVRHATEGSRSPVVGNDQTWLRVVAVVGDVRQTGLAQNQAQQLYVPFGRETPGSLVLVARTIGDPLAQVDAVRRRIHTLDPTLPFYDPTTLDLARQSSIWTERLASKLLSGFGALALLLAFVGVYGVMAFLTRQRDRELGLRLAIGASRNNLLALVMRRALGILAPGLVVGTFGAGVVSIVFRNTLFGVSALDPPTMGVTVAGLLGVGLLAAYLPARRATRLDPSIVLRGE